MVKVVIGGDICPVRRSMPYFINGDAQTIFNDLLSVFEKADLTVVNLECPLIKKKSSILKSGPVLGADSESVNGLKNAHIQVVGLANNHIMDHGAEGLRNTISTCRNAGLAVVGAGENLNEAQKILIYIVKDLRIAILACAEHEFSIATNDSPGANPLNLIEFVRTIKRHKDEFDYLIVLLHGGKEHYPYPSPEMQQICRFMIEEGANAVICQHSHCPGCYEDYIGGHIIYGQGNLIFDAHPYPRESWYKGYLVDISVKPDKTSTINIIPYIQSNDKVGARRMKIQEEKVFRYDLQQKSAKIIDTKFVEKQWKEFCSEHKHEYFGYILGYGRYLNYINKRLHLADFLFSHRSRCQVLNVIRCETHREILKTVLSNLS